MGDFDTTPGLEWDALRGKWIPVDYTRLSEDQLRVRRELASNREAELEAQLKGFIPASAAQALLNKGAIGLQDLLIKLAKKAPETLLSLI